MTLMTEAVWDARGYRRPSISADGGYTQEEHLDIALVKSGYMVEQRVHLCSAPICDELASVQHLELAGGSLTCEAHRYEHLTTRSFDPVWSS